MTNSSVRFCLRFHTVISPPHKFKKQWYKPETSLTQIGEPVQYSLWYRRCVACSQIWQVVEQTYVADQALGAMTIVQATQALRGGRRTSKAAICSAFWTANFYSTGAAMTATGVDHQFIASTLKSLCLTSTKFGTKFRPCNIQGSLCCPSPTSNPSPTWKAMQPRFPKLWRWTARLFSLPRMAKPAWWLKVSRPFRKRKRSSPP